MYLRNLGCWWQPPSRVQLKGSMAAGVSPSSSARNSSSLVRRPRHASNTRGAALEEKELSLSPTPLADLDIGYADVLRSADDSSTAENSVRVMGRKLKALHSLNELSMFVLAEAGNFHAGNVSHALALLARSYRRSSTSGSFYSEFLPPVIRRLTEELPRVISDFEARDAALCLWAMSVLGYLDRPAFNALCYRGSQVAVAMNTIDCANIMTAFGRLQQMHPDLLRYIPQVMLKELEQVKPREVSSVLWGFSRLGKAYAPGRQFMEAISDHMLWAINQYGCRELVTSLWAMAVMEYRPAKKLLRAAERRLIQLAARMNPQDTGNALWAFGRMRYKASELLEELPRHIAEHLHSFKPQEMSCLLFGYTQARHYHSSLMDAAAPVIAARAPLMSAQDMVMALWAYGIFAAKPALSAPAPGDCSCAPNPEEPAAGAAAASHSGRDEMSRHEHVARAASNGAAVSGAAGDAAPAHSMRQASGTGREASSSPSGSQQDAAERVLSSHGASTSCSGAGHGDLVSTLVRAIHPQLRTMRPVGLGNLVKALANLRTHGPEVEALLWDVSQLAAARTHEFRPVEMANLLYGLSHMRFEDLKVFYACEVQLIRLMESGLSSSDPTLLNHKVLNSIVHSCISAGYTPLMLIESAEIRNIRVSGNPNFSTPRWQDGPPGFRSRPVTRRTHQPGRHGQQQQQEQQEQQEQQPSQQPNQELGQQQQQPQQEQLRKQSRHHKHRPVGPTSRALPKLLPTVAPCSLVQDGLAMGQLQHVRVMSQQAGKVLGEMVSLQGMPGDAREPSSGFMPEGSSGPLTPPPSPQVTRYHSPGTRRAGVVQGLELQTPGLQVQGFEMSEMPAGAAAEPQQQSCS